MKTFMIELRLNNNNKLIFSTHYIKSLVQAKNKFEASKIVFDQYRKYYTGGENGVFEIGAQWEQSTPTLAILKQFKDRIINQDDTVMVRSGWGDNRQYAHFSRINNLKDLKEEYDCLNFSWNEVYYFDSAYHVPVSIYGCEKDCIIKSFPGNTAEVYEQAMQFVRDNTQKTDIFKTAHWMKRVKIQK